MSEVRKHPSEPEADLSTELKHMFHRSYLAGFEGQQVEIAEAKELISKTKEAIYLFKAEVFSEFSVGEQTKHEFNILIEDLLSRQNGISVDESKRLYWIDLDHAFGTNTNNEQHYSIETNLAAIRGYTIPIRKALSAIEAPVSPNQLETFSIRLKTFHELGHAMQQAYANLVGYEERGSEIVSLAKEAIRNDIVPEFFNEYFMDSAVEGERFPESLAYFLLGVTCAQELGLSEAQTEEFLEIILNLSRKEVGFDKISPILEDSSLSEPKKNEELKKADDFWKRQSNIGYFTPYNKATIQAVLDLCP